MVSGSKPTGMWWQLWIFTPFLILPIILYGIVSVFSADMDATLASRWLDIGMLSGGRWQFHFGDALLVLGLVCLFVETLKSTSTRSTAILNHGLSMGLLVMALIMFLSFKGYATSVFFLLILMAALDVVGGFIVSIIAARRDFGVGDGLMR